MCVPRGPGCACPSLVLALAPDLQPCLGALDSAPARIKGPRSPPPRTAGSAPPQEAPGQPSRQAWPRRGEAAERPCEARAHAAPSERRAAPRIPAA